jgi:hypothetical protein
MNFKASVEDIVELVVDVPSDFSDGMIPKGTRGTVVERYEQPKEGYSVDLAIPDDTLVGGFRYANVVLLPEQFIVQRSGQDPD